MGWTKSYSDDNILRRQDNYSGTGCRRPEGRLETVVNAPQLVQDDSAAGVVVDLLTGVLLVSQQLAVPSLGHTEESSHWSEGWAGGGVLYRRLQDDSLGGITC